MNSKPQFCSDSRAHVIVLSMLLSISACAKTIYVDKDATGANDGTSWGNAYVYLQDALADANLAAKPVDIRVAQGVYRPDRGDGIARTDRAASFQLISGVAVRGGYAGLYHPDPDVRDVRQYEAILSGDLGLDDSDPWEGAWKAILSHPQYHWQMVDDMIRRSDRDKNSYTVVTGSGTDETAVIDGFTISSGHADGAEGPWDGPQVNGAGMYNKGGCPTVLNCTFLRNTSCGYDIGTHGAGMFNSDSNPVIGNCKFVQNVAWGANAVSAGGGVFDVNSSPVFDNCVFHGNMVDGFDNAYYGPALYDLDSNSTLVNCFFLRNLSGGSAIMLAGSDLTLTNCTFTGQLSAVSCDTWFGSTRETSSLLAASCIFGDNIVDAEGRCWSEVQVIYSNMRGGFEGAGNIDCDPCFVNSGYIHDNGTPDESYDDLWIDGDDYHLKSQAGRWDPDIAGWILDDVTSLCIDAGDPTSPIGPEVFPNGGLVNMGGYGGTAEASKTYFGGPACQTIVAGDLNGDCRVDFRDFSLLSVNWLADQNP